MRKKPGEGEPADGGTAGETAGGTAGDEPAAGGSAAETPRESAAAKESQESGEATGSIGAREAEKSEDSKPKKSEDSKPKKKKRDGGERAAKPPGEVVAKARSRVAQIVWLLFVVAALFLAVGALCVALGANKGNGAVKFILDGAKFFDLGIFSRSNGIKTFGGDNAAIKNALFNWGIAAVLYLVVGRIVERIIRP